MKKSVILILLAFLTFSCTGKKDMKVTGEVILEGNDKRPVEVFVYDKLYRPEKDDVISYAKADDQGRFEINVPGDENYYMMHVAAPGYEAAMIKLLKSEESPKLKVELKKRHVPVGNQAYLVIRKGDKREQKNLTRDENGVLHTYLSGEDKTLKYQLSFDDYNYIIFAEGCTEEFEYDHGGDYINIARSSTGKYRIEIDENNLPNLTEESKLLSSSYEFIDSPVSEAYQEYANKFDDGKYSSFAIRYDIIVNSNDKGNIFNIPLHELENVQNKLIIAYDKRMAIINEKMASAPNSIIRDLYLSKKIHMLYLKEELSPDETLKMIETMENIFVDNIIFVPVIDSDEFKKHPEEYLNKLERIARRAKQKEKVAQLNYYIYSTASNYLDGSDPELFDRIESRMNRIVMDADEDWVKEAAVKLINRVKIKNMDIAPDFEFVTLNGEKKQLSDYRGKWVLLNFWSMGCGWCIREFPYMKAAYDKYHGRDFEIISINTDGKAATAEYLKEFIRDKDLIWINTSDNFGYSPGLSKKYGVSGVPAMYLIDPEGRFIKEKILRGEGLKETVGELLALN